MTNGSTSRWWALVSFLAMAGLLALIIIVNK
jgi:hypothetical protein